MFESGLLWQKVIITILQMHCHIAHLLPFCTYITILHMYYHIAHVLSYYTCISILHMYYHIAHILSYYTCITILIVYFSARVYQALPLIILATGLVFNSIQTWVPVQVSKWRSINPCPSTFLLHITLPFYTRISDCTCNYMIWYLLHYSYSEYSKVFKCCQ
jgi:hypothetical protein